MPQISLTLASGAHISAYRADPAGAPKGAVVVVQEIFGINPHIRSVVDFYASHGYVAITPALFDFAEKGVELAYDQEGVARGFALMEQVSSDQALAAIVAAQHTVASVGKVAIVGFCWGGTLAYHAASSTDSLFACASCYYGGGIAAVADKLTPKIPTILHFGEKDAHITPENVAHVAKLQPQLPIHLYPADHGFNCEARGSFEPNSAAIAKERTLNLFAKYVG